MGFLRKQDNILSAKTHFKDTQKKHFQDGEINASQKQPFYESN